MKFNKKAMTWQQLVLAILAVIVVTFVIIWFKGGGESAYGNLGKRIGALGDCDKDNVADMFDKCPCAEATGNNKKFHGCPSTVNTDEAVKTTNIPCDTSKKDKCKSKTTTQ